LNPINGPKKNHPTRGFYPEYVEWVLKKTNAIRQADNFSKIIHYNDLPPMETVTKIIDITQSGGDEFYLTFTEREIDPKCFPRFYWHLFISETPVNISRSGGEKTMDYIPPTFSFIGEPKDFRVECDLEASSDEDKESNNFEEEIESENSDDLDDERYFQRETEIIQSVNQNTPVFISSSPKIDDILDERRIAMDEYTKDTFEKEKLQTEKRIEFDSKHSENYTHFMRIFSPTKNVFLNVSLVDTLIDDDEYEARFSYATLPKEYRDRLGKDNK
jgi:hypothetical protein